MADVTRFMRAIGLSFRPYGKEETFRSQADTSNAKAHQHQDRRAVGRVAEAASMLDRAAKRGAIHKNAARRKRSRVAKRAAKSTKAKSS